MGGWVCALPFGSGWKCAFAATLAIASAAFFMPGGIVPSLAQSMSLPGGFSVSETGGAGYSIPIAVPPGTAGMAPSLSLTYNSQAGNGLLGMGWMFEGLPSIGRCPRTIAQDGVHGAINFDADDCFCMDGQRLVAVSGDYGADGTEYRTEVESFSKVVSHGTAGAGPAWFEVRTKTGQIMEFGNSTNSRILAQGKETARSWAVNKVADTKGNYFTVTYVNDAANGEAYPSRIDYTGNDGASLAPYNSVRLVYETRPDSATAWHAGSMVKSTVRMSKVQTYAGDTLVADYRLAYQQGSSTERSQLTSVTLCEGGGQCLPATTFTWQDGTTNQTIVNNVAGQDGMLSNYRSYLGDFNGDGMTDIMWDSGSNGSGSLGTRVLWTSVGNGGFAIIANLGGQNGTLVSSTNRDCDVAVDFLPILGDFNRDGRADILWIRQACRSSTFTTSIWTSTATGAYAISDGPSGGSSRLDVCLFGCSTFYFPPTLLSTDFVGDGRTDLLWSRYYIKGGDLQDNAVKSWITNPDGSMTLNDVTSPETGGGIFGLIDPTKSGKQRGDLVDFNGDGIADTLWLTSDKKGFGVLWFGNGDGTFRQVAGTDSTVADYAPSYGDFNGDGQTDIFWDKIDDYGRSQGTRILWFSKGDGTFEKIINPGGTNGTLSSYVPYSADFNGDGRADVFWSKTKSNGLSNGARVLWIGKGNGTFIVVSNFGAQDGSVVGYAPGFGDFNGDGATDVLWDSRNEEDVGSTGTRILWLSDGVASDLITGVANGLGATITVSYKSLTDGSVYTRDNSATDPVVDLQGPVYVVSRVDQSNGIGGTNAVTYAYAGAKSHLDGRGFLGFRQIKTTDLSTNIVQTTTYRQDFPITGLVASQTKTRNGVNLGTTANTYGATALTGTRNQVYLAQSEVTGADLNGTVLASVTSTYQYDAYGNTTQIVVTNSDGYSKTTTNTYVNDAENWLLGRLVNASVTSQAPAVDAQTPADDTTPDPFDFADVPDAALGTVYEASAVISGFNRLITASVSGAEVRKNGKGEWRTSVPMAPGDTLNIRMTSSSAFSATATATLTAGGISVDWSITTIALDDTPDPFDFADVVDAAASTSYEASAVITGINAPITTTVSGSDAEIRKNGTGDWGTSATVNSGDTLNVRMTSSDVGSTSVTATVTAGAASADWAITTELVCSGNIVGGHCWYLGASGQSCDAVCSSHGGCNLAGTRDYAGTGGTLQNCQAVLSALGYTNSAGDLEISAGVGCGRWSFFGLGGNIRFTGGPTTCSAQNAGFGTVSRACACNN